MTLDITAYNLQGTPNTIRLNKTPDMCPVCHKSVHPKVIASSTGASEYTQTVFQCTSLDCQELFIGSYERDQGSNKGTLIKVAPVSAKGADFPNTIHD